MADVSSIIQRAYYIAGLQSKKAGDTISATEEADGEQMLNNILDARKLQLAFSSFFSQLAIQNLNTGFIYIGRNITGGSNITVIDEAPFKMIFGAAINLPESRASLLVRGLATLNQTDYLATVGTPGTFYYANELQNNNIYTKCLLQPQPTNAPIVLFLSGLRIYEDAASPSATIETTFINYLTYLLAKELSNEGGTRDLWNKRGYEQDLKEYERILHVNAPIDSSPNDLSRLGERSYFNNYPYN
jgi:hypothetical protein